jgi:hypothetical protein
MSALLRRVWLPSPAAPDPRGDPERRGAALQVRPEIEALFRALGLLSGQAGDGKERIEELVFLLARLAEDALAIDPDLRRSRRPGRGAGA